MEPDEDLSLIAEEIYANGDENKQRHRPIISGEQLDIEAYAALYSGRTKIMRLLFIADRCGNASMQLEALRMAYDEIKKGENTQLFREVVQKINGRLGTNYGPDPAWADSVDRRADLRKEKLESELNAYRTNLIKESIRMGYNDFGDFYYAHGQLGEAFKNYVRTRDYCTTAKHIIHMCLNAILVSIEMGQFTHVTSYVSKAEQSQDALDAITVAKLRCAAGLAHLEAKKYKLAARKFLEVGPELGNNYTEVIAPQDVATYGGLCALASFDRAELKSKVIDNINFRNFLELVPEIRELIHDFYTSHYASCLEYLGNLKANLLLDIHLHDHVETLYDQIRSKALIQGRSMLSGDNRTFRGYSDDVSTSRSEGAATSETQRIRRRKTPKIGDDVVRAVIAMNEALKQNRLLKEQEENSSYHHASINRDGASDLKKDISSQRSMSLPSSPHELRRQVPESSGPDRMNDELVSTWNRILESHMYLNKPLLPYEEWNIDFSELTVGTRVGIGFFGEVFRGKWNGTEVAIKVFLEQDLTAENMEDFCNEISILSRLRHPNVILFLGACANPPHLSMVTEYMEMGSLYHLIHVSGQKNRLSWKKKLNMLRDICRGLMCLHRMKIVHRDLKSANCLVNKRWTVKICDFGLSRIMTDASMRDSTSAGTPEWMAPELIRNEPFTEKCDIFSFGVIMWELCTLNRPWEGIPPDRVVYAVANEGSRVEIPEGPLGKLIADCWAEPNERPNCEEIFTRLLDCEYSLC